MPTRMGYSLIAILFIFFFFGAVVIATYLVSLKLEPMMGLIISALDGLHLPSPEELDISPLRDQASQIPSRYDDRIFANHHYQAY